MQARRTVLLLALVTFTCATARDDRNLEALYDAHKWTELSVAVSNGDGSAFFRGVVAEMFNDPDADTLLRSVIHASPHSDQAYEAYEWLSHLYLRTGQYGRLVSTMQERWKVFPGKKVEVAERTDVAPFQGLPDQTENVPSPVTLHHDGTIFLPLSVNGKPAKYFFDTGAWLSSTSESEAKRLGLDVQRITGSAGTAAGSGTAQFHMAVAREVTVGNGRYENVSFPVFPDNQEPWSDLAVGQKGVIGIPVLLGLNKLVWAKDGTVVIGGGTRKPHVRRANLFFDDDHLVLMAGFQHK